MQRVHNLQAVQFGQTIDKVVFVGLHTEIGGQVNDAHIGRNVMGLLKSNTATLGQTKEYHVNGIEGQFIGKVQVSFAIQASVYVGQQFAGSAFAVHKHDFGFRVVQQQAAQFACCKRSSANNPYLNHCIRKVKWMDECKSSLSARRAYGRSRRASGLTAPRSSQRESP